MNIDPTKNQLFSSAEAPFGDVVLSSRARLARNVKGFPFVNQSTDLICQEINEILQPISQSRAKQVSLDWIPIHTLNKLDSQLLVERHIASSKLIESKHPRAIAIGSELSRSVMVNEEDHLRIQSIKPGLQLEAAHEDVQQLDEIIEKNVPYAFHERFGYLTACPTNLGTGARFSVMVHLPGLCIVKDLPRIQNACKAMSLAIRGFRGEGSKALGDLFQVSNQVTLGFTEEQLLRMISDDFLPPVIEWERKARMHIIETKKDELDDLCFRALGTLQNARILNLEEAMKCLGDIRLGITTERIQHIEMNAINQSFINIQPAHIKWHTENSINDEEISSVRCQLIRELLNL